MVHGKTTQRQKNCSNGKVANRPKVTVPLTLFVDQLHYIDEVAGEGYRSQVAQLLIDLAIVAEKTTLKEKRVN